METQMFCLDQNSSRYKHPETFRRTFCPPPPPMYDNLGHTGVSPTQNGHRERSRILCLVRFPLFWLCIQGVSKINAPTSGRDIKRKPNVNRVSREKATTLRRSISRSKIMRRVHSHIRPKTLRYQSVGHFASLKKKNSSQYLVC